MSVKFRIVDGSGSGASAKVTSRGELVTGHVSYSSAYAVTVDAINTGYNFVGPQAGKQFVITGIYLYANKNVGARS